MAPLESPPRDKALRKTRVAERALSDLAQWMDAWAHR
jgi:hypothetical protein